jgi:hypothetical protein
MTSTVTINSGTEVLSGTNLPDIILGRTIDPVTHDTLAPTLDLNGSTKIGNVTDDQRERPRHDRGPEPPG